MMNYSLNILYKIKSFRGILLSLVFGGILLSQDSPEEFDFNISIYQSFYFFQESDIDGSSLELGEDWIASFTFYDETNSGLCSFIDEDLDGDPSTTDCQDLNNDGQLTIDAEICTGSYFWDGPYTTVPVMGNDGTRWTVGYLQEDDMPFFKIYDASENIIYPAVPSMIYPWTTDLNFYVVSISAIRDCDSVIGGNAVIDNCGECTGGTTNQLFDYLDLGCGCFNPEPDLYYEDTDGDGLGSDDIGLFCEHPGVGWVENSYDEYPDCFYNTYDCNEECGGNAVVDECGICAGGSTNISPNFNIDCNGECFGGAYIDECDYCVGGGTGLEPCDFISTQPEEFYFQQSTLQAFYFIINAYIGNGNPPSNQDWIGVFINDVCVGSVKYDGAFTTIPAMGDDGSDWTESYLQIGQYPSFKLWDASQNLFYPVNAEIVKVLGQEVTTYTGWYPNDYYNIIDFNALIVDCSGVLDGGAFYDSCGECVGGQTGIEPDFLMDCANVCNGNAYYDNCGICVGGSTNIEPNLDDLGCGCYLDGPQIYYSDFDNDGFGYGEAQEFCDNPGQGWSVNNLDEEPYCFNQDLSTSLVDDCGVCEGGNNDLDCAGICFGTSTLDDCGVCGGDNSSCNSPISNDLTISTDEDAHIEIVLEGSDPGGNPITYFIAENPQNGELIGELPNLTYVPNENYFGLDTFTYQLYNGQYYSELYTVSIEISSQNDAPTLESLNLISSEDEIISFNLVGSDFDEDSLTYSVFSTSSNSIIVLDDNQVIFTPNSNFNGEEQIIFSVTDGIDSSQGNVTITVLPVNDAPTIGLIEDAQVPEGGEFQLSLSSTDIDSNDLYYSVSVDGNASAYVDSDTLIINPFSGYNGDISVTVYVSDGYLSDSTSFNLEVLPVNDAPVLSFIGSQIMEEDNQLVITLEATDPEDDDLTFEAQFDDGESSIDGNELTIIPNANFNGSIDLWVYVTDGSLGDSEDVTITVLPVNDAPYFVTTDLNPALENSQYSQIIEVNDVDNDLDELTLSISNNLGWIELSENYLTGVPNFNSGGTSAVILNLSDNDTSTSIEYSLLVQESNQSPVSSDLDLVLDEDSAIVFNLLALDPENDDLTYQLNYNSVNGVISGTAPLLTYTPNTNYYGSDSLSFIALDSYGNQSNSSTVSFDVLSVNDIPQAESATLNVQDDTVSFDLSNFISDADGDILSFSTVPPSSLDNEFSSVMGGSISRLGDEGSYSYRYVTSDSSLAADYIIYKVKDNSSESSVEIITLVLDESRLENRSAPSALDDNVLIMEDTQNNISLIGFDIVGFPQNGTEQVQITQSPSYGAISNPSFVQSSTNQVAQWVVSYTPNLNFYGNDEIRYKITNPNNTIQESQEGIISIVISDVNDPPTISSISDQEINEDNSLIQNISCSDVDHSLDITASSSIAGFNFQIENIIDALPLNESNLTIIPPLNYSGNTTITVTASESNGDVSVSKVFNLNVLPVNDTPVLDNLENITINEDESHLITLIANDVDFDVVSFSAVSDNENILIEINNNLLGIYGTEHYFGLGNITVTADDGQGGIVEDIFELNIESINDLPSVENLEYNVIEDGLVSIFPQGTDIESSDLTFSVATAPENGTVSLLNWAFVYTPNANYNGLDTFSYVASDGSDISLEGEVKLTIEESNDAPLIQEIDNQSVIEDSNFVYEIQANDIDQDVLFYDVVDIVPSNEDWSLSGNLLTIPFTDNFNGDIDVTVSVSDGSLSDIETFIVTVDPVNDTPNIQNPISDLSLDEDFEVFSIDISDTFSDIDQDDLEFSLSFEDNDVIDVSLNDNEIIITSFEDKNGGPFDVIVTANDRNRRLSISDNFNIIVSEINDAPIAINSQFNIEEDRAQIIQPNFSDVDNDNSQISVSVASGASNGSVSIIGQSFVYTPDLNFTGQDSFSFSVFDQEFYSNEAELTIFVVPTNDPPLIDAIANQQMSEDSSLTVALSALDIDGDNLIFNAEADNTNLVIEDDSLIISPYENFNGLLNIILSVSDGEFSDATDFSVDVLPVNDAPSINQISDQQINEDNSFSINLAALDIDGDQITFTADTNNQADVIISGNLMVVTPEPNFNGEIGINVSAEDSSISSSMSFFLNVLPVNDAPSFVEDFSSEIDEDTTLTIVLSALDIDDDILFFEADLENQSNASINLENNLLTITPDTNWFGELLVNIAVSDLEGLDDVDSFVVNVLPVNDAPQISSEAVTTATEDLLYQYQLEIDDPDSDVFYYNVLMAPDGLTISNEGLISWIPTEGILTSGFISLVVWDTDDPQSGQDYPAIQEFQIIVDSVNDSPSIVSVPNTNATEDETYNYQVIVDDIDDQEFIFNLINHPEGMTINNEGLITWLPLEGVLSSGLFTIEISDGYDSESLTDSQTYAISVTPVNDAPQITSIAPTEVVQNALYQYQIGINDPDDDSFTFQLVGAPEGMNINFSTFVLSWIPEDYGTYGPIILKVIDGGENFAEPAQESIIIQVTPSSEYINMEFDLHQDNNLISFLGIPDEPRLSQVFAPLGENINQVITEGLAASFTDNLGWIGSLDQLSPDKGYWIDLNEAALLEIEALPTSKDFEYVIHDGYNLLSYISNDGLGLDEALPDYMEEDIVDIITEGLAATRIPGQGWVGSLTNRGFRTLKGYWLRNSTEDDISFSWVVDTTAIASREVPNINLNNRIPDDFKFSQSSKQAFYFFKDIVVDEYKIKNGDWVLAFNGNKLVGSRKWDGEYTDIPVMGYDGKENTLGYCTTTDVPSFKIYDYETGDLINIDGNFPNWHDLATHIIDSNQMSIPHDFSLSSAYPNPFNPKTSIEYSIPYKTDVSIVIYDLVGRQITTIVDQTKDAGTHRAVWNASNVSSGMYFVKMNASNFESSQKLILIK